MKNVILILVILSTSIYASTIGAITALTGKADIKRSGSLLTAQVGDKLQERDSILTKDKSKVQIIFNDDTIVTIGQNSNFSIAEYIYEDNNPKPSAKFGLTRGAMRTITGKIGKVAPKRFSVKTDATIIGIRGTNFTIRGAGSDGKQQVYCTFGAVDVKVLSTGAIINVARGTYVSVAADGSTKLQEYSAKDLTDMQKEEFPSTDEEKSTDKKTNAKTSTTDGEAVADEDTDAKTSATNLEDADDIDDIDDEETEAFNSIQSNDSSSPSVLNKIPPIEKEELKVETKTKPKPKTKPTSAPPPEESKRTLADLDPDDGMTWGDWENPTNEHKLQYWFDWADELKTSSETVQGLTGDRVVYEGKYIGTRFLNSAGDEVNDDIRGKATVDVYFNDDSASVVLIDALGEGQDASVGMYIIDDKNLMQSSDDNKDFAQGIFYGEDGNYINGSVNIKTNDNAKQVDALYQVKKQ
jgi:hypothetical protein